MSERRNGLTAEVQGHETEPAEGWELEWVDQRRGIARLATEDESLLAVVEGGGTDWHVVLRGRRIPVSVRSWRERMLAEAREAAAGADGPLEIRSTLPGLVVAVHVEAGVEVAAGASLLTIEAMKMQNEVRAPREGRIGQVAVSAGQPVAAGVLLLRLE
ncbi:MAG TPA: acetyl-CoA carboxylase biotin carboxyl carrier protein subunit [Candidatus Limnocylindria bacterium]|jgi:acetyl/propionyl-CoA carboxylase alpha subunit